MGSSCSCDLKQVALRRNNVSFIIIRYLLSGIDEQQYTLI